VPSFPAPPPSARAIQIVIADDHPVVRAGVKAVLAQAPEVTVIGEAADGQEALNLVRRLAPDVLILDLAMPRIEGIDVLRTLQDVAWRGRAIILTSGITREQTLEALQTGVSGVLAKSDAAEQLVAAVRAVDAGRFWFGGQPLRSLVGVIADLLPSAPVPRQFGLTQRERDIIALVVEGQSNREIAASLKIAEETVKQHIKNVFDKTGVSKRLELALFAIDHGLVRR